MNTPHQLVVDGLLKGGGDSTFISLSYTRNLADTGGKIVVAGAFVSVENETGDGFRLEEMAGGIYAGDLPLVAGASYRLEINTGNGKAYQSDYVPYLVTPAIDSVNWTQDSTAVHIAVNTHDTANATRYYRWDYVETWQYHTYFKSNFDYVDGQLVFREPDQDIYTCWIDHASSTTLLASTENLASDLVTRQPVQTLALTGEQLYLYYSIIVREYALTAEGFHYWETLKKTTESTGTLFDPQPSTFPGNYHCLSDSTEPVLGYLSASSVSSQRIFIQNKQVSGIDYLPFYIECSDLKVSLTKIGRVDNDPQIDAYLHMPKHLYTLYTADAVSLTLAENYCVDCRTHGGTNVRPAYWPF